MKPMPDSPEPRKDSCLRRGGRLPRWRVIVIALLAAAVLGGALALYLTRPLRQPVERDVSESFIIYLEDIKPSGKLVLLTATDRYTATRDFTAMILSLVKVNASVEISAVADTSFCVDLADTKHWRAVYNSSTGLLAIKAPPPGILPPAVRTDTIEVRTKGENIISSSMFNLKKEAAAMQSQLSADIAKTEQAAVKKPEIQQKMADSLSGLAGGFCSSVLKFEPKKIEVSFFTPEEAAALDAQKAAETAPAAGTAPALP